MKRPLPNLIVQGFRLALRNWPFLVWAYAINLAFGLLAAVPFATGLAPFLDHSLAAQKIAGTLDYNFLSELRLQLRAGSLLPVVLHTGAWLSVMQLGVLFALYAGTVFAYVSAEPPQISVLMRGGAAYFWRFIRAALLAGGIAVVVLGGLLALRAALLNRADAVYVEGRMFLYSALSAGFVLLVGLLLRLWWDLVEVYIVRNVMDGERRVRRALLPALKLMFRHFFRTVGSFLFAGLCGLCALGICLYLWNELVPARQVWLAFVLSQVGLFCMLCSRFWQRGIEAALVMSVDPPMVAAQDVEPIDEEEIPVMAAAMVPSGAAEPTLRDLVLKLRTDPWAPPETPSQAPKQTPTSGTDGQLPDEVKPGQPPASLLDRHISKFPLGGLTPQPTPAPTPPLPPNPKEKAKAPDKGKSFGWGKKP